MRRQREKGHPNFLGSCKAQPAFLVARFLSTVGVYCCSGGLASLVSKGREAAHNSLVALRTPPPTPGSANCNPSTAAVVLQPCRFGFALHALGLRRLLRRTDSISAPLEYVGARWLTGSGPGGIRVEVLTN